MSQRSYSLPACLSISGDSQSWAHESRHTEKSGLDLESSDGNASDAHFSPIEPMLLAVAGAPSAKSEHDTITEALSLRVPRKIISPSIRRSTRSMYRGFSWIEILTLIVPGVLMSLVSGGVPVAMTHIIGRAFAAFAAYRPNEPSASDSLSANVRVDVYVLLGLAAATLLFRTLSSVLWLFVGERGARKWRRYLFNVILQKDIAWFDLKPGSNDSVSDSGAAGLMALFLKDTDDARTAMGQQAGYLVLHIACGLASFVYAMYRQWSLTLIIFASVPVLALVTIAGDVFSAPLQTAERSKSMQLTSLVEKGATEIRAIKAFNAQHFQQHLVKCCVQVCKKLYTRMCVVWGVRYGLSSALGLLTFVQGFAWGGHLVRSNRAGPDAILATFLASLVTMGQLQSALMRIHLFERGKNAAANMLTLGESYTQTTRQEHSIDQPAQEMKGSYLDAEASLDLAYKATSSLKPQICTGELVIDHVWMAYPSRPDQAILRDVSMRFAAGQHTYVVGRSGSGKSTVANILLRLYEPTLGTIHLDNIDVRHLSTSWFREQVAGVSQHALILEHSLFENVACGACTPGCRNLVREAISAVSLDDVLDFLPDGLDTTLGQRGKTLSGGQMQRVALARALLRDPAVLILDEVTSALDHACASNVLAAIRAWRQDRTTIYITHDISSIQQDDYCYVMEDGRVIEQGSRSTLSRNNGVFKEVYLDHLNEGIPTTPMPMGQWGLSEQGSICQHNGPTSASAWSMESSESGKLGQRDFEMALRMPSRIAARHVVQRDNGATEQSKSGMLLPKTVKIMLNTIPDRIGVVVALINCIASGVTTPAFAYTLTQVLMVVGRASTARLAPLIGATAGIALVDGLLKGIRLISMEALGARWVASLRIRAMRSVLAQDLRWFDSNENAATSLAKTIVKDAEDASACLGQLLGQIVALGSMLLVTLIWAFIQGWQLTLCAIAIVPLAAAIYSIQGYFATKTELKSKQQREKVANLFFDQVASIRSVRAMNLESALQYDANQAIELASHLGCRAACASSAGAGFADALTYVAEALLYGVGALLLMNGVYDLHRFMLVLNPVVFAVGFASQLAASMPTSSKSMHALQSISRLLHLDDRTSESHGNQTPKLSGQVEFDDVSFAYGPRRVLNRVSFQIEAGERVALVGPSGTGKSTIAALVQRFYEPDSGSIRLDGHMSSSISAAWLREHIAFVGQMPSLFPTSIGENIAMGTSVDQEKIHAAAQAAQASFIEDLPDKYATQLGSHATSLSGGQTQRIAIARALLRTSAKLLVLDEFTASLDPTTKSMVVDAVFSNEAEAPTVLLLTHDVSLMRRCDRIIMLNDSHIAYDGPPSPLLG
ncbi:ABC-type xenobiotic transporter [Malassezia psittaci]|uniref:ABC-type xenobiotic transporter n=1 Tax=Malassezia psittaci TaxID=1821823 RepID=A0AAF0JFC6_9BASI|nr:ABC-type xenobiotic transporter [Malassezia psittaci]